MSTSLQLLANYYRSVLENERLYYNYVNGDGADKRKQVVDPEAKSADAAAADGVLSLQKQVQKLNSDLQVLRHENDRLKELQKTHKALMASKLKKSKETIESLQKSISAKPSHIENPIQENGNVNTPETHHLLRNTKRFHLLSPMVGPNHSKDATKKKLRDLRHALDTKKHTLFDDLDSTDQSKDNSDDRLLAKSIRKGQLDDLLLSTGDMSPDDSSQPSSRPSSKLETKQKKRKLIRKRIQTVDTDDDTNV